MYVPTQLSDEWDSQELLEELRRIESSLRDLYEGRFVVHHAEPTKRREGMIVYADGTDWNPLSGGKGFYRWDSAGAGAWVKVG